MTCGQFEIEADRVEFYLVGQLVDDGTGHLRLWRYWAEDGELYETDAAPADGYGWPSLTEAFFDAVRWALEHHLRYSP